MWASGSQDITSVSAIGVAPSKASEKGVVDTIPEPHKSISDIPSDLLNLPGLLYHRPRQQTLPQGVSLAGLHETIASLQIDVISRGMLDPRKMAFTLVDVPSVFLLETHNQVSPHMTLVCSELPSLCQSPR